MTSNTTFSEAVDGYLLYAESRHLSVHTITDYLTTYAKFGLFIGITDPRPTLTHAAIIQWIANNSQIRKANRQRTLHDLWQLTLSHDLIADPPLTDITPHTVERFLASFNLKKKTILNYHVGLGALWTWAVKEKLVPVHILHQVDPPKPEETVITPYTQDEIKRLLEACVYTREYSRPGARATANRRQTAIRDKSIIMILLDTGIRAQELCDLKINDLYLKERRLLVRAGKGSKQRHLYFSSRTGRQIWRYLNSRCDDRKNAPVFSTTRQTHLTKSGLLQFIKRAGDRADVPDPTTHRFRHTFAIQSLRNGMNVFVLQQLLGHSSMDMVRRYLKIANTDLSNGHNYASPVDNWRL